MNSKERIKLKEGFEGRRTTVKTWEINFGRYSSLYPNPLYTLTVHEIEAQNPGFLLGVNSGTHGSEDTSVIAALEICKIARDELSAGTVVGLPIANLGGVLITGDRGIIYKDPNDERKDLNRVMKEALGATPGERRRIIKHAKAIIDIFSAAYEISKQKIGEKKIPFPFTGLVIDLHTEDENANSDDVLPYARLDPTANDELLGFMIYCAEVSGIPWVMEYDEESYKKEGLEESLTAALVQQLGIPAITIELGPIGRTDPRFVNYGKALAHKIMCHFKMLATNVEGISPSDPAASLREIKKMGVGQPLRLRDAYRTDPQGKLLHTSGICHLQVKPGDFVEEGQLVGYLENEFSLRGDGRTPICAPFTGWVLSTSGSTVFRGEHDLAYTAAVPELDPRIVRLHQEQLTLLGQTRW